MSLYQVVTGAFINAADINQVVKILQQPSGGQETGKYFLIDSSYAVGASTGDYISSISRGATPVSITIDTADQAPSNCNTPSTSHLTSNGCSVSTTSTAINTTMQAGGNYTLSF